jgi:hypothetical protein
MKSTQPTKNLAGANCLLLAVLFALSPLVLSAAVTGSISGTVTDSTGAIVPGVTVEAANTETGVVQKITNNSSGFYNFPALPVGHYTVTFRKDGFQVYRDNNLLIDVDTALRVDAVLQVGTMQQEITVTGTSLTVNTQNSQNGEVIEGTEMANLPLNGRAYTDLLSLQPGVLPFSVAMFGNLSPSGNLNAGILSMSGTRDMNNGYMVNGANTVEGDMGGATIIPNLDSIGEFRIITSNAGAEYGNYSGGQVNVVTKSGTNQFHGDAFEFLRNSDFDARNFFSPTRGVLKQNQFGGAVGGPVLKNKVFFFVDYQGTRQTVGVDTGNILVPSAADRAGNLSDVASQLTGTVNGTFWANQLSQRLGYGVTAGEPYYKPGCTTSSTCVFPNAVIPQSAWSPVSANVISLIPLPNSGPFFSSAANPATLQDDKGAIKVDVNSRIGLVSGYYFDDPWLQTNPYNPGYGGSTVPGFPSQTTGNAKLATLNITTSFGPHMINQFTASYMRNRNISGLAQNTGPTLASLGFAPPAQEGIYQLSTQYQNVPELSFNNYTLGAFNSVITQFDNTYQFQDGFTKIIGSHTVKFGADYHWDQVDIAHPNNGGNGGFGFNGGETGYDFADMLIGAPSYFFQGAPSALNLRSYYVGAYAEDNWRVTHNLTFSYGLRWEATPYWSDSRNRNPDVLLGLQSQIFPGAPTGYVFPGDPGVPTHFANPRWNNFGPRLGLAYSPSASDGLLHRIFGEPGKSSIRAGYGMYYTNIQGAATFNFAAAPYGLFYFSSAPRCFPLPLSHEPQARISGSGFPFPLFRLTSRRVIPTAISIGRSSNRSRERSIPWSIRKLPTVSM